jgi:endonuclease YncB( thermonuclease family)
MHKNLQRSRIPRMRVPKTFLFTFILLIGGLFFAQQDKDRVVRVHDGDTITVLRKGSFEKIRLYGIDSPESDQPGGSEARNFASNLAFMEEVQVTTLDLDQYGRAVALVQLPDGRLLNEELLRNGQAWVYRAYCKELWCPGWIGLERKAKQQKAGLWAQKKPVPPWEWRKRR